MKLDKTEENGVKVGIKISAPLSQRHHVTSYVIETLSTAAQLYASGSDIKGHRN